MLRGENLKQFNKNRIGKTYEEIFGKMKATMMKKKLSIAIRAYALKMGTIPPSRKGVKDSLLTRQRKSATWKKRLLNKQIKEQHIKRWMKSLLNRPTSLEKTMINLIKKNHLPYKYTGDGSFLIGYKNPDFININGEKKLIEVGNLYHHQNDYINRRTKHFAKYGWQSYIFIGDKINEKEVLQKLGRYQ